MNLYTDTNVNRAWSLNKITQDLEKELKPSRYTHTLNVAKTAKNMAEAFNVNPNKAYFAGIYTIVQRISATKNFCRYARTIIFQLMYSKREILLFCTEK